MNAESREILEQLVMGVRKQAAELRVSPLDLERWPAYPAMLAALHDDCELVMQLIRDAGCKLRVHQGVPLLEAPGRVPMVVPSRASALFVADLSEWWTGFVPSDSGTRRALALLRERALKRSRMKVAA